MVARSGKIVTSTLVLFTVAAFATFCIESRRRPISYVIPEGFEGWVVVSYDIASAPPLPVLNGALIAEIPDCGFLKTSSKFEEGWARDSFAVRDPDGTLRSLPLRFDAEQQFAENIWGVVDFSYRDATGITVPTSTAFFVGSRETFEKSGQEFDPKDVVKMERNCEP